MNPPGGGRKHSDQTHQSQGGARQAKTRDKSQPQPQTRGLPGGAGSGSGAQGGQQAASVGRKRKIDSTTDAAVEGLDLDSSSGDGGSSTSSLPSAQTKISRADSEQASSLFITPGEGASLTGVTERGGPGGQYGLGDMHSDSPAYHRYIVQISDAPLLHRGGARSYTDLHAAAVQGPAAASSGGRGRVGHAGGGGVAHGVGGEARGKRSYQYFRFDCELGDMWTEAACERITRRGSDRAASTGSASVDKAILDLEQSGYSMLAHLAKGRFGGVILTGQSTALQKSVAIKICAAKSSPGNLPSSTEGIVPPAGRVVPPLGSATAGEGGTAAVVPSEQGSGRSVAQSIASIHRLLSPPGSVQSIRSSFQPARGTTSPLSPTQGSTHPPARGSTVPLGGSGPSVAQGPAEPPGGVGSGRGVIAARRGDDEKMEVEEGEGRESEASVGSWGTSGNESKPHPSLLVQLAIHSRLKHENVVQLYEHHVTGGGQVSLVLELCEFGSLRHLLAKTPGSLLGEETCRRYFRDMLEAVAYLHSQDIVHRDIRCDHFLVDRFDRVKLCDFAFASHHPPGREERPQPPANRPGTAGHWPPEVLERRAYSPRSVDMWALGVTLHVLLTSRLPFPGDDLETLASMQHGLDLATSKSVRLSREVTELLHGLLHYVLHVRYTVNRVRCSDWLRRPTNQKPYVGNFYRAAKTQKFRDSSPERLLKESFGI